MHFAYAVVLTLVVGSSCLLHCCPRPIIGGVRRHILSLDLLCVSCGHVGDACMGSNADGRGLLALWDAALAATFVSGVMGSVAAVVGLVLVCM
jgi:hypothetical protein